MSRDCSSSQKKNESRFEIRVEEKLESRRVLLSLKMGTGKNGEERGMGNGEWEISKTGHL